jgi:E3 ubiquitin-protein ligase MARCH6
VGIHPPPKLLVSDFVCHSEPLSDVPIDLLFLHFVLPYTMHYFRPKKFVFHMVVHAWKHLARYLRLTSYMFGDRYPMEEFTPQHASWTSFVMTVFGIHDPRNIHDGSFRRVPASDNVALPRDMRATAEVNSNGEPITEAAAKLIQLQNSEAEKAKRNVKSDFMVVYIPPHFRYRIMLFISALWIAFAIFAAMAFSVPILLGRGFFKLFAPRDVHDGYSFITGFYLLWGCYIIGQAIDRMDKRRQRRGPDGPRAEFSVFLLKRSLLWLAKISYMLFFLGLVIPILISLVMDFYVVLPIRLVMNPALKPRIRIVDAWAIGLLYAKIGVHAHRLQHPTLVMRGLNNVSADPFVHHFHSLSTL